MDNLTTILSSASLSTKAGLKGDSMLVYDHDRARQSGWDLSLRDKETWQAKMLISRSLCIFRSRICRIEPRRSAIVDVFRSSASGQMLHWGMDEISTSGFGAQRSVLGLLFSLSSPPESSTGRLRVCVP